jgi:hypothetical protein
MDTYRRGQIEWALWRFIELGRPASRAPSKRLRAIVKYLLQFDRSTNSPTAITTRKADGKGTEAVYPPFDAFCLVIAFDLTRFGFKQSEALLLLSNLRPRLHSVFFEILANPPPFPEHLNRDGSWKNSKKLTHGPDRRVFLLLQWVELAEAFPALSPSAKKAKAPIFQEPQICRGLTELKTALNAMDHQFRRAFVLEIAHTAARVTEFLNEAPIVKRGRK